MGNNRKELVLNGIRGIQLITLGGQFVRLILEYLIFFIEFTGPLID